MDERGALSKIRELLVKEKSLPPLSRATVLGIEVAAIKGIVDLIDRQEAENDCLNESISEFADENEDLRQNNHLKADAIDRMTNTMAAMDQKIHELKAENERLREVLKQARIAALKEAADIIASNHEKCRRVSLSYSGRDAAGDIRSMIEDHTNAE